MSGVVTGTFIIEDETDDYLWLEIMDGVGAGLQTPIPKDSSEYDGELQQHVSQLSESNVIEATLVSKNEKNTAWGLESIRE
jgi:hypothetical protein